MDRNRIHDRTSLLLDLYESWSDNEGYCMQKGWIESEYFVRYDMGCVNERMVSQGDGIAQGRNLPNLI